MRGELETEQRLQHIDPTPNSSDYSSISFAFYWAAQPGAWGPSLGWDMILNPATSLQLIWTSCRWGYIIIWRPPTSCERHISHSIQPVDSQGYPRISSTGCTCYLHGCISSLTARPGRRSIRNACSYSGVGKYILTKYNIFFLSWLIVYHHQHYHGVPTTLISLTLSLSLSSHLSLMAIALEMFSRRHRVFAQREWI